MRNLHDIPKEVVPRNWGEWIRNTPIFDPTRLQGRNGAIYIDGSPVTHTTGFDWTFTNNADYNFVDTTAFGETNRTYHIQYDHLAPLNEDDITYMAIPNV